MVVLVWLLMRMPGRAGNPLIIAGCRLMRKCLQHLVAEQRFRVLAVVLLIIRRRARSDGRKRLVCVRRRPIIPGRALERRALPTSTRLARRCLQLLVLYIGRAADSGHAHHWQLSIGSAPWISRTRVLKDGLRAGQCASRRRITKDLARSQVRLANIQTMRKASSQKHVLHLGLAGVELVCVVFVLCAPVLRFDEVFDCSRRCMSGSFLWRAVVAAVLLLFLLL